jgi:hypothetical protein
MTIWQYFILFLWTVRDDLILEYLKPITLLYRKATNG